MPDSEAEGRLRKSPFPPIIHSFIHSFVPITPFLTTYPQLSSFSSIRRHVVFGLTLFFAVKFPEKFGFYCGDVLSSEHMTYPSPSL